MLDRDDLDARPDGGAGVGVVGALVASDPVMDLERKRRTAFGGQEDGDLAVTRRGGQVARERRDAAATRRIRGNEGGPCDDWGPLKRSASLRSGDGTGALWSRSGGDRLSECRTVGRFDRSPWIR